MRKLCFELSACARHTYAKAVARIRHLHNHRLPNTPLWEVCKIQMQILVESLFPNGRFCVPKEPKGMKATCQPLLRGWAILF